MKQGVALALVALAAFTAGWWIGRTGASDLAIEGRLAALEEKLEAAAERPAAAPAQRRPERRGPDPDKVYQVALGESPARGPADAAVTIVEFSDFECPFCRRVAPTLDKLIQEYPDDIRVVWKDFPLSFHRQALPAHKAAHAAAAQGKFWEVHDWIFENPDHIQLEKLKARATELGLDMAKFETDMNSAEVAKRIAADIEQGRKLGVSGTPAFFVNGRFLSGAQPYAAFKERVEQELAKKS